MKKTICNSVGKHQECKNCGASKPHYNTSCEPCPFIADAKCFDFKSNMAYSAFHKPTKEEWYLLGISIDRNEVCAAGYPSTIADLTDCENIQEIKELTEAELNYRTRKFGNNWD